MFLSAQISLYPLRQQHLSPVIGNAVGILKEYGLEVSQGTMSSVASGEDDALFAAIKKIFQKSAEQGDTVMVVTLSNACPLPQ